MDNKGKYFHFIIYEIAENKKDQNDEGELLGGDDDW